MNHPLIANSLITQLNDNPAITTEFVVNESLRNHLSDSKNPDCSLLKHPTKIAKIIAGIALAMQYVHSKGIIHLNQTRDNILLDWDWKVWIADFGCSTFNHKSPILFITNPDEFARGDPHYLASECYDRKIVPESDIFSFDLIVYEFVGWKYRIPEKYDSGRCCGKSCFEKVSGRYSEFCCS
jgi:serine/threonine protein kinase